MALTQTNLTAAITASQLRFGVASTATGFPPVGTQNPTPPQLIQIDSELMWLAGVPATNTIDVRMRGTEGTYAIAHDTLAAVLTSPQPNDFGAIPPGQAGIIDPDEDQIATIGQDGAIPIPSKNTIYNINKATAAALTLAAPTPAMNGLRVTLTSQTAVAHIVTATALLAGGVTGSPLTTATFGAFKGASVALVAENGLWNVLGLQGVALS